MIRSPGRTRRLLGRKPKPLRNWSLRAQILAGVLTLFVVLSASIGLITALALKHSLVDRLDNDLAKAAGRSQFGATHSFPPSPLATGGVQAGFLLPRPSSLDQIAALFSSTQSLALIQRDVGQTGTTPNFAGQPPTVLPANVQQKLQKVPTDHQPHTVVLPGLGSYRVLAIVDTDSPGNPVTYLAGLPLRTVNDTVNNLLLIIVGLTILGLIIAALLCTLLVRLALRPLGRVRATASRVAEMSLDEGEVALAVRVGDANPHTEVGQVGVALNRMLENVSDALIARHQSETRVRQFVADASHELRTPLAAIRGYAELTRRSAQTAPPDVAHAMSRVESEATRMTTLVEDLLLLARLDAGRPLEATEVDLTSLTFDVLSDAHAAGPEHRWQLRVPDEPVTVIGDPARLHQVLANLLANARTHTPSGTEVDISLEDSTTAVSLSVRDNGPGVAPELINDIFERFSRGEASRSRAAGSTGLGLAIVSAVVAAHSGTISVRSQPGDTVFTVTLPSHREHEAGTQTPASLASQSSRT